MSTGYVTSLMITGSLRPQTLISSPILCAHIDKVASDSCIKALNEFDLQISPTSLSYWKYKIIVQHSNAPKIVSISFLPKNISDNAVLFLQKISEELATGNLLGKERLTSSDVKDIFKIGFVVPFLSEEEQNNWGALSRFSRNPQILNQDNFESVTAHLDEDVKNCVRYFFNDVTTSVVSISYHHPKTGFLVTEAWTKLFC